jgi:2-oxoglutarate ferredoxin oxidoreductase subunit beta
LANHRLRAIGVSGDGDTASIGLGGWAHLIRRNLPMVYIVENNGVYGLTKGQFSATADEGTTQKSGEENPFVTIDLCSLAIELGCGFVARAFSGDRRQLVAILQAAFHYRGLAIIDVVSPCVTFANHDGSTKSFSYVKTHQHSLQEIGFVPPAQEIRVDYPAGTTQAVSLHDGSQIILRKLDPLAHDVRDAALAYEALTVARRRGEILTGMLFFDEEKPNLLDVLKISDRPLCSLTESDLRPSEAVFASWLRDFY